MTVNNEKLFSFDLIDSAFTGEDALDVLRTLIRAKIQHHQCRRFSDGERLGYDRFESQQRCIELKKSLALVEQALLNLEQGEQIELKAEVHGKLVAAEVA